MYQPLGNIYNTQKIGSFESEIESFIPEIANPRDQQVADSMKAAAGAYGSWTKEFGGLGNLLGNVLGILGQPVIAAYKNKSNPFINGLGRLGQPVVAAYDDKANPFIYLNGLGQTSDPMMMGLELLSLVGSAMGLYHGYKKDKSIGWALAWAVYGGALAPIAIPHMFIQGFGKEETFVFRKARRARKARK